VIVFSGVSLIYPTSTRTILEDLTFTVSEGELVLVIGSTGSGKSSLLRLINGLVPHHTGGILAGDIKVNGISTRQVKPGGLAHLVGIVGQNPLNGFVTDIVEEELAFGMETLNLAPDLMRKRVEEVLDLLSLAHLRSRSIATLSGGEQQRVAIGSALVMHPKILVLDEPTSALDPIAAEEVLSILHRLVHDLGLTVIISEHKLERVIQFADRIIHINADGQTHIGTPREVLKVSDIAPPIVELARALNLPEVSLTVRDMRRVTERVRRELSEIDVKPSPKSAPLAPQAITVKKVSHYYGPVAALRDISLEINEGEIVAIMGRNGAGKSSLLRSIAGVLKISRGEILVCGANPLELQGHARTTTIGFIPQEPSDLLFGQSVSAECRTADKDNRIDEGETFTLLEKLVPGISGKIHPRDLSEGQRLALALSVVLSAKPNVLILDEPTRGLDYAAKASLNKTLKEFAKQGCVILIATHDVELIAELATRTIFIADGDVVADGATIDVLLSSPAFAPQVAKIMSPAPWLTVKDVVSAIYTTR
jgi:energy-coupling factor transporter ATP-binding protein EcfA2